MSRRILRRHGVRIAAAGAAAALALVIVISQPSFGSGEATYVVQPGDSLWSISQEDGLTMQQLAAANGMQLTDVLLAGRTLVIPDAAAGVASPDVASLGSGAAAGAAVSTSSSCGDAESGPYGVLPAQLVASGATQLESIFDEWASYYGVSAALVEAIAWQESGWQQGVVSVDGAVGVGQVLPATAQFVSDDLVGEPLDMYSVTDNIRMTTRFVAYLADQENGSLCGTIAAYYEGLANLSEYGILPETQPYVADVEALLPRFE